MQVTLLNSTPEGITSELQEQLGGHVTEQWGECVLELDNHNAKGSIRCTSFDWGVMLMEYDLVFRKATTFAFDTSMYNPLRFIYCLEGSFTHRFESDGIQREAAQYQSVILTDSGGGKIYWEFPENIRLEINCIHISRKQFMRKKLKMSELMNKKLHEVFLDTDHERAFAYFGSYNLKLAQKISALRKVREEGVVRILMIEGLVYQILSFHLKQHRRDTSSEEVDSSLLKRELTVIRRLARKIARDVSRPYSLESLSIESGLSQPKLQEGFKLLYSKTVTEYIRNVRLEAARNHMLTSDMNISEIVYTIGLSSRSYFSKIFREKYGLTPSAFIKNTVKTKRDLGIKNPADTH